MDVPDSSSAVAARFTGRAATAERPLSGALTEVGLDDGRTVMVKLVDGPGAARAEAAGLRRLSDAGTVRVPVVHGADESRLVSDRVTQGPPSARAAVRFGREPAGLHAAGAPAFGAAPPGGPVEAYIGLAPMRNVPGDDWPGWYAAHRVLPFSTAHVSRRVMCPNGSYVSLGHFQVYARRHDGNEASPGRRGPHRGPAAAQGAADP
ncbi:hypothetical protein G3I32_11050 [Streptomyces coelicoflavus]|uniref:Fructosamine kinase n=1 Tax=Streptomyces coelicoflavus TaxID=285562 RepID=A0A7K3PHG4_9ACTN|nr:hypothetical protein [Streptomyces coelicoflavus]